MLLFISHSRAVFSDPGIVPLPSHPIDFSDEHQQTSKNKKGNKNSSNSIPSGLMTNQTPPDEGIVNIKNSCIELKRLDKNSSPKADIFQFIISRLDDMYKMRNVSSTKSPPL